jgi:hypothetical protein
MTPQSIRPDARTMGVLILVAVVAGIALGLWVFSALS